MRERESASGIVGNGVALFGIAGRYLLFFALATKALSAELEDASA